MVRSIRLGIPLILLLTFVLFFCVSRFSGQAVSSLWSVVSFFYQEPQRSKLMKTSEKLYGLNKKMKKEFCFRKDLFLKAKDCFYRTIVI